MTIRPYTLQLTAREILVLQSALETAVMDSDITEDDEAELESLSRRLFNLYQSR